MVCRKQLVLILMAVYALLPQIAIEVLHLDIYILRPDSGSIVVMEI